MIDLIILSGTDVNVECCIPTKDRIASRTPALNLLIGVEDTTPTRSLAQAGESTSSEQIALTLSATFTSRLEQKIHVLGLTRDQCIQGVWAVMLGRLTGLDDVEFGIASAKAAQLR